VLDCQRGKMRQDHSGAPISANELLVLQLGG
jgi:hypothetical protein